MRPTLCCELTQLEIDAEREKVEQYVFAPANKAKSDELVEGMRDTSHALLEALELRYRPCWSRAGDMGIGKYRMGDVESWIVSKSCYREAHSCSALNDW